MNFVLFLHVEINNCSKFIYFFSKSKQENCLRKLQINAVISWSTLIQSTALYCSVVETERVNSAHKQGDSKGGALSGWRKAHTERFSVFVRFV